MDVCSLVWLLLSGFVGKEATVSRSLVQRCRLPFSEPPSTSTVVGIPDQCGSKVIKFYHHPFSCAFQSRPAPCHVPNDDDALHFPMEILGDTFVVCSRYCVFVFRTCVVSFVLIPLHHPFVRVGSIQTTDRALSRLPAAARKVQSHRITEMERKQTNNCRTDYR